MTPDPKAWFRTVKLSDGSFQVIYRDLIGFVDSEDLIVPKALSLRNEYRNHERQSD